MLDSCGKFTWHLWIRLSVLSLKFSSEQRFGSKQIYLGQCLLVPPLSVYSCVVFQIHLFFYNQARQPTPLNALGPLGRFFLWAVESMNTGTKDFLNPNASFFELVEFLAAAPWHSQPKHLSEAACIRAGSRVNRQVMEQRFLWYIADSLRVPKNKATASNLGLLLREGMDSWLLFARAIDCHTKYVAICFGMFKRIFGHQSGGRRTVGLTIWRGSKLAL